MKIFKFLFTCSSAENKTKTELEDKTVSIYSKRLAAEKKKIYENKEKLLFIRKLMNLGITNPHMFFKIHREFDKYILLYPIKINKENESNGNTEKIKPYSEMQGEEKEKMFGQIFNLFINEKYNGNYIDQIYELGASVVDKKLAIRHIGHIEKDLEVLKFHIDWNMNEIQNKIEANPNLIEISPLHNYPNSRISKGNYDKFLKRYNDLQSKINTIKEVIGAGVKTSENVGWRNFRYDNPEKWDWRHGKIPIIPKYKYRPMGAYIGITLKNLRDCYVDYEGDIEDIFNQLKCELEKIPEYIYLCENGQSFNYFSLFDADKNSELSVKYKKLAEYNLSLNEIENSTFYIENLSLNEIKIAAANIKQKIQEEVEREEKRQELIRAEQEKQSKIERWNKIKKILKFEISDNNVDSFLSGVYLIHCITTNHIYIGSSDNMSKRKNQHLYMLRNKTHHSYKLQEAYDMYSEYEIKFYALETLNLNPDVVSISRILKQIEQNYINEYRPEFNIDEDSFGRKHYI